MKSAVKSSNESPIVVLVRSKCLERAGENGIRSLSRAFRIMDDDHSLLLSPTEFRKGLRDYGIALSDEEFVEVMNVFDRNHDGVIDVTEFLVAIRGQLNARRQTVIDAAFQRFDRDGSNTITINDIQNFYDVSRHPDVLGGKKTKAEALLGFLCLFDDQTNPDGIVTKEEFDQYYAGVSASIDNDEFFETLLIRAWNLDKPLKVVEQPSQMKIPQSVDELPGNRKMHPLYQTTSSSHGRNLQDAITPPAKYNRMGKFTRDSPGPWRNSSLNTSVMKNRVERSTGFGSTNPLL